MKRSKMFTLAQSLPGWWRSRSWQTLRWMSPLVWLTLTGSLGLAWAAHQRQDQELLALAQAIRAEHRKRDES